MTQEIFNTILGLYLFAIGMGISLGGVFAIVILVFRQHQSGAYDTIG